MRKLNEGGKGQNKILSQHGIHYNKLLLQSSSVNNLPDYGIK